MYCPVSFRETRSEILRIALAKHPLAALLTLGPQGIDASHIPLLYHETGSGPGVLRGHLARANPQWSQYTPGSEALAIFTGPQHYVTPAWYPAKQEHGKVVPTWNYVIVHVRGRLTFTSSAEWLFEAVQRLTESQEGLKEHAWRVSDAPGPYIQQQLNSIIGVEMAIGSLEGKWKLTQNRSEADREGVIAGLEKLESEDARDMAKIMKGELPA